MVDRRAGARCKHTGDTMKAYSWNQYVFWRNTRGTYARQRAAQWRAVLLRGCVRAAGKAGRFFAAVVVVAWLLRQVG